MALRDEFGSSRNSLPAISPGEVFTYCLPRCLLHGHTVERRSLSQSVLLRFSQSKFYGHRYMVLARYRTAIGGHTHICGYTTSAGSTTRSHASQRSHTATSFSGKRHLWGELAP